MSNELNSGNEIEINLDNSTNINETKQTVEDIDKSQSSSEPPSKPTFKTIESKPIANLTDDERASIIASTRNGFEQPYYDVKFFKNGNTRIIRRKSKQNTTLSQSITSQPIQTSNESKRYYTDNQLLFEHIIELNSRIDKLTAKHKKLKKKYNNIQHDIYADEDDIEPSPLIPIEHIENDNEEHNFETSSPNQDSNNIHKSDEVENTPTTTEQQSQYINTYPQQRSNWRSRIKYL